MKKFFRIFAVAALACATFVACEQEFDSYDPAQPVEGVQAYFSNEGATEVSVTKADSKVEVTVMRGDALTAASIPVTATINSEYASLFTVAATANFETGKKSASLPISFDGSKLKDGAKYEIVLSLGDDVSTPYGKNTMTLTIAVPEPYVLLGKGLIREDIIATMFAIDNIEWEVEVYENLNNPGFIYLKNAYTSEFPYNDPGDYVTEDKYFVIDVRDPNKVIIPKQGLGCDWNPTAYGEIIVGTAEYGKLENGIITFPTKGLLVGMEIYNDGGFGWYANSNGLFRVCLPGAVLTDFSLNLSYSGIRADADNRVRPVVDAVFGADVAEIQYSVFAGNIQYHSESIAAAVAGMADGSYVSATVAAVDQVDDEEELLQMELVAPETVPAAGVYTMVAVPLNADGEAQVADATAVAFYVNSVSNVIPEGDFDVKMMTLNQLYAMFGEVGNFDDATSMAWFATGSNIKAWKQVTTTYAQVEKLMAQGMDIDDIALAAGSDYEDLHYINNDGYDYGYYQGLTPATTYMMIHYVEDLYGNQITVGALHTTAEAKTEAAEIDKKSLKTADVVKFNGNVSILGE